MKKNKKILDDVRHSDITQKRNVAVMIVTHDENVVKYGTAKYYMEDGKIRKYE